VEDAHIENSDVGPMGRIRPGSLLKDTHIGNFVEVKKSTLTGVKRGISPISAMQRSKRAATSVQV